MTTVDIPKQQRAAIKEGEGADAKAPVQQIDVPTPSPGEILVKINWHVFSMLHVPPLTPRQDRLVCFRQVTDQR
jgi:hypothetical protein